MGAFLEASTQMRDRKGTRMRQNCLAGVFNETSPVGKGAMIWFSDFAGSLEELLML